MTAKKSQAAYALKIQGYVFTNDPWSMWVGIKSITDYNRRDTECPRDPSVPDAPNTFMLVLKPSVLLLAPDSP